MPVIRINKKQLTEMVHKMLKENEGVGLTDQLQPFLPDDAKFKRTRDGNYEIECSTPINTAGQFKAVASSMGYGVFSNDSKTKVMLIRKDDAASTPSIEIKGQVSDELGGDRPTRGMGRYAGGY